VRASDELRDDLLRLERALAERDTGALPHGVALGALVTDDFLEFGSSGRVWDAASVHHVLASSPGTVSIEDFAVDLVADDVALATYRMTAPIRSNRSSLWVRRDGRWVMRFHQGTRTD
jgi:hypothetical protein